MRYKTLATGTILVLGCAANADVVLDQISLVEANNPTLYTSQDFEPALPAHDLNFIDDFTVDPLHINIDRVEVVFGLRSGPFGLPDSFWANVTGIRVEFYSSVAAGAANLTGDLGSTLIPIGGVTRTNLGFITIASMSLLDMSGAFATLPGAGTYWMGIMGVMDATAANNQIGPTNNGLNPGNQNGTFINPGGFWGFPGNSQNFNVDISYRIHSTPIPEPASLIALGIGAAALLARRRRRLA